MSIQIKNFIFILTISIISPQLLSNSSKNLSNNTLEIPLSPDDLLNSFSKNYINSLNYLFNNDLTLSDNFIQKIIQFIAKFWVETEILPTKIILNRNFTKCVDSISHASPDLVDKCVKGSGKSLNDLGSEYDCEYSNYSDNENKTENETENENKTEKNEASFLSLQFYVENSSNLTNQEDEFFMNFINAHYFYVGLCLPKYCTDFVKFIVDYKENKPFLDYMYWNLSVNNFSLQYSSSTFEDYKKYVFKNSIYWLLVLFEIYFGIKFIIGILRIILIPKGYDRYYLDSKHKNINKTKSENSEENNIIENNDNDTSLLNDVNNFTITVIKINDSKRETISSDSSFSEDVKFNYNDYIYGICSKKENGLYNPFFDKENKYKIWLKIIKCLDLFDNLKILTSLTNKYYNSCNIKQIYFIKFIVMFQAIILEILRSQMKFPPRNFLINDFFTTFNFWLIKICIYSSEFWIILDAFTAAYKIMSYIKKQKILGERIKNANFPFYKIFLLIIPHIVVFFFSFIFLHIFAVDFTYSIIEQSQDRSSFSNLYYYNSTAFNSTYTIRKSSKFTGILDCFIPFKLNYLDYFYNSTQENKTIYAKGDDSININNSPNYTYYEFDKTGYKIPSPFLTNAELFINIYFNEFYLLIFMLLVIYISYKAKNKIFDFIILGINIILYFLPIFNLTKYDLNKNNSGFNDDLHKADNYTLPYVLGQNYSEKYTHYFINFYFFGFLIGIMFFYHTENLYFKKNKNNSSYNINILKEMPFYFCNSFIIAINKFKFIIKRIILWSSLFFIFLISLSFYFIQKYIISKNNELVYMMYIKDYPLVKFIFLYEKNLCSLFFYIFLIIFIVYPTNKNIYKFSQSNFFILFDRINFSFYCIYKYFVYMSFCLFVVEFKITYITVFFDGVGFFILVTTFSILCVALFELPVRIIIKSNMNKKFENELKTSRTN